MREYQLLSIVCVQILLYIQLSLFAQGLLSTPISSAADRPAQKL